MKLHDPRLTGLLAAAILASLVLIAFLGCAEPLAPTRGCWFVVESSAGPKWFHDQRPACDHVPRPR